MTRRQKSAFRGGLDADSAPPLPRTLDDGATRLVIAGWTSLKSKVGRRLLLLFVSCAVTPLVVALYVSFSHVTDQLYQQSEKRLVQESKAVGMAVLRELLILPSELERIESISADPRDAPLQAPDPQVVKNLRERFRAVTLIDRAGTAKALFGPELDPGPLGEHEANHLAAGKSLLSIGVGADHSAHLMLEIAVAPDRTEHLIAEVDPEWLVQSARQALTISDTSFCVLDSNDALTVAASSESTSSDPTMQPDAMSANAIVDLICSTSDCSLIASADMTLLRSGVTALYPTDEETRS